MAYKQLALVLPWQVASIVFNNRHQVLLGLGYYYLQARHIPESSPLYIIYPSTGFYVKNYETSLGQFRIALSSPGDPHISLPSAYILNMPEQYEGLLLPHVNFGWYLCYVQEMEADWDANDLSGLYFQIDCQIQRTLDATVTSVAYSSPNDQEIEGEFASYWLPRETLYLLSDADEKVEMRCYQAVKSRDGNSSECAEAEEWIACSLEDKSQFYRWLNQRSLAQLNVSGIKTSYFRVKPSCLAGMKWPPNNFRETLLWLKKVDPGACNRLVYHFINNPVKRHVLLFEVYRQDIIGVFVEINLESSGLNTYPKKKNRKRRTRRTIKPHRLIATLSSRYSVREFARVGVTKADKKTIIGRNRRHGSSGDLSAVRIALIGCGTVGGHLGELLLRSGAGCGQAGFDLYDKDSFGPQNFGRHALSTMDIGINKAVALAASLKNSTHLDCSVEAKPQNFSITALKLKQYDIVIDVTGRPPVAKRLAHVVRTIALDERPTLIHGFNDGNGRSSKVLIDNGTCCYGCLIHNPAFYKDGIDLRFSDLDLREEHFVSCGSTFVPYDAAVSLITAAMVQEGVLSILEPNLSWTYNEHMLDGIRTRKPRLLNRYLSCPICHD